MSLTRKPLKDWKRPEPTEMSDELSEHDDLDTPNTTVPKRKSEVLETVEEPSGDVKIISGDSTVSETVPEKDETPRNETTISSLVVAKDDRGMEPGMCQTWKRQKKGGDLQQCTVRPRNGNDKCCAHGNNRREIQERDKAACDVCVTTVSKGSLKKHEESNRHHAAEEFAAAKKTKAPEPVPPPPEAGQVLETAELEVPKKKKSTKSVGRARVRAIPQDPQEEENEQGVVASKPMGDFPTSFPNSMGTQSGLRRFGDLSNLTDTRSSILMREPKDYSQCFGVGLV